MGLLLDSAENWRERLGAETSFREVIYVYKLSRKRGNGMDSEGQVQQLAKTL